MVSNRLTHSADPIQASLGGLSMLQYVQDWTRANLNSSNPEVLRLAQHLFAQYGDGGSGNLKFATAIGYESVIGGSLFGTYVSIHDEAATAVGEIQLLSQVAQPPSTPTYGGLEWTSYMLANGQTAYWAPDGSGKYFTFGSDGALYHDSYPGAVHAADQGSNYVGKVVTYPFPPPKPTVPSPAKDYGGLDWTAFTLQSGDVAWWAPDSSGSQYYYFGADQVLYHDSYPGQVQPEDLSNSVGNVTTYAFP